MLDGIIGPWFLAPFLNRRDSPLPSVVLRPELPETLRRAQGRAGRELRESGPIRSLHQQFSQLGGLEPHALDTTALTAGQTVAQVRAALAAGRLRLPPGPPPAPGPALAPRGPAPAFLG